MTPIRLAVLYALAAALAGCGSKPVIPPATVSNSHNFMASGMQAYQDNRYAEARNFFGRAFMEYRSVDDQEHEAHALTDLADAALQQGDVTAARENLSQAHAILDAHPVAGLLARLTLLDAYADLQAQDPAAAATALDGLLNDAATPADVRRAALFARTQAAYDAKSTDAAQWLAKLGAPQGDLEQARLARLQALGADPVQAANLYADALKRYQTAYYRPGIAATHEEWGGLLLSQQQWKDARDHLQRALDIRLWMYDASHSVRILDGLQKADTALGDADAAKRDQQYSDYLKNGGDPSKSPTAGN
jgi:tetratricopeptide (TPR) repeat protein